MNKNRATKSLSILLAMCMLLGMLPMTALADNFSDIKGHWAESQINEMINEGIVKGYPDGSFKPDGDISRAEFVSLIVKAFKLTKAKGKDFDDISNHWAKDAILTANAHGIVNGYSDTKFGPDDPITREQMAVIIVKVAHLTDNSKGKTFVDSQDISEWAKKAVAIASSNQLITGYPDNTFKPSANTSRAEAAVVLGKSLITSAPPVVEPKKPDYSVISKAGTYGPKTGTETVTGNVTVKAEDTILQNLIIKGDLTIAKEVGDGDVTLDNIKVLGKTFIRGGGKDSIHINGGDYNDIIIESTASGAVRIVATNTDGLQVVISANAKGEEIILNGEFKNVTVNAEDVKVITQADTTINELKVPSGLKDINIELAKDSSVKEIVLNSEANVRGQGTIKEASGSKAKDSRYSGSTQPDTITTPAPSGGGGGGSSSSSGSKTVVSAISVKGTGDATTITTDNGTLQMVPTVTPDNASNKAVTWTVTETDGTATDKATISNTGLLTAVKNGTVKVTATAKDGSGKSGFANITITNQMIEKTAAEVAGEITTIAAPAKDATSLTLPTVEEGFTVAIKTSDNEGVIALNGTITPPEAETTVALVLTVTKTSDSSTADTSSINVVVPAKTVAERTAAEVAGEITTIAAPAKDATSLTLPTVEEGFTVAIKTSDNEGVIALNGTITPPEAETTVALVLTVTKTSDSSTADTSSINVVVPAKTVAERTAAEVAGEITTIAAPAKDATSLTLPTVEAGFTVAIKTSDKEGVIATDGTITPPEAETTVALVLTVTKTSDSSTADTSSINVVVPAKTVAERTAAEVAGEITTITAPAKDATSLTLPTVEAGFTVAIKTSDKEGVIATDGTITPPEAETTVALVLTVTKTSDSSTADTSSINVVVPAKTVAERTAAEVAGEITTIAAPAKDATSLTLPTVEAGFTVAIKTSDKEGVIATDGTITPPEAETTVALVLTVTKTSDSSTADTSSINVVVPAKTVTERTAAEVAGEITTITAPAKDATSLTLPTVEAGFTVAIKTSDKEGVIATDGTITPPEAETTVALVLTVTKTSDSSTADTSSINVVVPAKTVAERTAAEVAGEITTIAAPAKDATSLTLPTVEAGFTVAIKTSDKEGVIATDGTITPPEAETTVALVLTVTKTSDSSTADTSSINVVVPAKTVTERTAAEVAGEITTITAPAKDATSLTLPTVEAGFTVAIKTSDKEGVIATDGTITPPEAETTVALVLTVTKTSDSSTADTSSINVVVPAKTVAERTAAEVAGEITTITAPAKDATSLTLPTVEEGFTVAIKTSDNEGVIALNGTITPPEAETTVALVLTVTKTSDSSTADTSSINVVVPAKTVAADPEITDFTFTATAGLQEGEDNAKAGEVAGTMSDSVGGTSPFTYSLVAGDGDDDNGKFEIVETDLKIKDNPLTEGTYKVRIQIEDIKGKKFAQAIEITVAAKAVTSSVTSVTVTPKTASVEQGETLQLTANVVVEGGAAQTVTWTSSDINNKVQVDLTGKVIVDLYATAGDYTITATSTVDNTKSDTATITVTEKAVKVTSVTLNKYELNLSVGGEETLTATVEPEDATNKNVTWESNDTSIATVDGNGKVAAVAVGTATISVVSVDDSEVKNTCTVIVTAAPVAPKITTIQTLSSGSVDAPYSQKLEATGTEPITWNIESGDLPDGLSLNGDTISGTPTKADTFSFTIKATNDVGSDSKTVSVMVKAKAYSVTVTKGTADKSSASAGELVNITANEPEEGYVFDKWESEDVGVADATNAKTNFAMPAKDVTVEATYKAKEYTVTVSNDGNGTGSASPATAVAGTEIALSTTPNSGYKFKEWQIESGEVTISSNKFTMPAKNVKVKAIFEAVPTYSVTYHGNGNTGGNVPTDGKAYEASAEVIVLDKGSLEKTDYVFDGWNTNVDGTGESYAKNNKFNITEDITLYAQWLQSIKTIEITGVTPPVGGVKFDTNYVLPTEAKYSINGGVGWIDVETNQSVMSVEAIAGKNYKFSITLKPNDGYAFEAIDDMTATVNSNTADIEFGGDFKYRKVICEFTAADPEITDFTFTATEDLQEGGENTGVGKVAGTFSAEVGGTDPFTYELVSGNGTNDADNNNFEIDGKNLKIKDNALTEKTYKAYVEVTDNKGKTFAKAIEIEVAAAPLDPEVTGFTFTATADLQEGEENTGVGKIAGTFGEEQGGTAPFTYALVEGNGTNDADNNNFEIDGKDLKIKDTALTEKTYKAYVEVTDNKGKKFAQAIEVTVAATPADKEIQSVKTLADINVANGTVLADVNLPATVEVTLDDSTTKDLAVTWNGETPGYDGDTAGTYAFEGTLTLVDGISNTANVKAIVKVVVERIKITNVEATSTITNPVYGAEIEKPTFDVKEGKPAYFNAMYNGKWQKKNEDDWVNASGKFSPGTWRYRVQIRIDETDFDGLSQTTHKLVTPFTVKVDEVDWSAENNVNGTTYTTIFVSSLEYEVTFVSFVNDDTANDEATLGIIGTSASSSNEGVATAEIDNGKIKITSHGEGEATITVSDELSNEATIEVVVAGGITIGAINKYEPPLADQEAPTGLAGVAPTTSANNDGKITGTTTAMEYKLQSATEWTPATETKITGLAAGTYQVRLAAKEGYNASPATEVTVPEYEEPVIITANGSLLQAVAGTDFTGVLYTRDGKIYYNQRDKNGDWSEESEVAQVTDGRLAIDNSGTPHVAYVTEGKIAYSKLDGGSWSDADLIVSNFEGICSNPDIAVDSNGKAHITYTDSKGSTGDYTDQPDIMYATNSSGSFNKGLIYKGYRAEEYGYFYSKGSKIAVDGSNNYYILSQVREWGGSQSHTYSIIVKSNSADGGTDGQFYSSTKELHDIYGITSGGNKVVALYKGQGTIKTAVLAVESDKINFNNPTTLESAAAPHSVATNGSDIVVAGVSGSKLQIYYNGTLKNDIDINVKAGTKVSVVHVDGEFYAVYTDNSSDIVKTIIN